MSTDATQVTYIQIRNLRPMTAVLIAQLGQDFLFEVMEPDKFSGVLRPYIPGQAGAGWRDAACRVGTRPFIAGREASTVLTSEFDDHDVEWGYFIPGRELVAQNLEGAETTMTFGVPIAGAAAGPLREFEPG